jgi:hypothetical protein
MVRWSNNHIFGGVVLAMSAFVKWMLMGQLVPEFHLINFARPIGLFCFLTNFQQ